MSATSSSASKELPADLINRYSSAIQRFASTSAALASATTTSTTPTGTTPLKDSTMSPTSSGLRKISDDSSDLLERLARLATTEPPEGRPPLETYTTTPTEHGDIFRATPEFRDWIRSRYRGYGVGDHGTVKAPCPPPQKVGGDGTLDRFKKRAP